MLVAAGLLLLTACSRHVVPARNLVASETALSGPVTATATETATPPADTPVAGASFQIGAWQVVVERFRAQVSAAGGVNVRSSPEVRPDNRIGSLPPGSVVNVEGRVPSGQEAEPGKGTTWYFLGTAGQTPQFIYGAAGTLQPLGGSATPGPLPATPAADVAAPGASAVATLPPLTVSPTPAP